MLPPRAYVFIGLNMVRALSIIALLLLFASSIFTMVRDLEAVNAFNHVQSGNSTETLDCDYFDGSTVPHQPAGPAFAVLNWLLIIFQSIVLILSEIGWPMKLFDTFFPILGSQFGVGALGVIQCLLGATVLSHYVDDFSLVSAFFLFSIGLLNVLVGLIFRASVKPRRSITSWKERAKDVLPPPVAGLMSPKQPPSFMSSVFSTDKGPMLSPEEVLATRPGFGFGRQGEKKAALKGFLLARPVESLPRYASKPGSEQESGAHAEE